MDEPCKIVLRRRTPEEQVQYLHGKVAEFISALAEERLNRQRAEAAISAVRALHVRELDWMGRPRCAECASLCHSRSGLGCDDVDGAWPCPTIAALDSSETPPAAPDGGHLWGSDGSWCRRCAMVRTPETDVAKWPCTGRIGVFRNAPPAAPVPEGRSDEKICGWCANGDCANCDWDEHPEPERCKHNCAAAISGAPVDGETT